MTRVEYIIAAWTGVRFAECPRYQKDHGYYIKAHVESLHRLKHNLSGITVVLASGGVADHVIGETPGDVNGVPVKIIVRENDGLSYGSFNRAISENHDATHFILMDDDYVFTRDHFDGDLMGMIGGPGMVCGMSNSIPRDDAPDGMTHASVFLGIIDGTTARSVVSRALAERVRIREATSLPRPSGHYPIAWHTQVDWSWAILDAGGEIKDWLGAYTTPFWNSSSRETRVFDRNPPSFNMDPRYQPASLTKQAFAVPLQVVGMRSRISNGDQYYDAVICEDGRIEVSR